MCFGGWGVGLGSRRWRWLFLGVFQKGLLSTVGALGRRTVSGHLQPASGPGRSGGGAGLEFKRDLFAGAGDLQPAAGDRQCVLCGGGDREAAWLLSAAFDPKTLQDDVHRDFDGQVNSTVLLQHTRARTRARKKLGNQGPPSHIFARYIVEQ